MFAQNSPKEEPIWYQLERDGKYAEVTEFLIKMVESDSTRNKHADYLHISRNFGYMNNYEKAIIYLNKSVETQNEKDDEQFWWYYKGTLAFFERNKLELKKYLDKLENNHSDYYVNNYNTLKSLYEKFEKGYKEASDWKN
jgi:tetratricopeptide (TPR) repeat protein